MIVALNQIISQILFEAWLLNIVIHNYYVGKIYTI